ncbi:MAG: UDP-N-acetylglucosamine 1-carboxyvinyltransferase, partial [Paludibacteraceae bacterium]|nr:UDP-N-acetylglucosamine 1-carboxyvinyltransferase [Paludibacteraceae bacterium]
MAKFVIEGGHQLRGEITPQGAKNEALEVICATVLSKEAVTISNVPNILDVNNLIQLMMDMGIYVRKEGNNTYTFKAEHINED